MTRSWTSPFVADENKLVRIDNIIADRLTSNDGIAPTVRCTVRLKNGTTSTMNSLAAVLALDNTRTNRIRSVLIAATAPGLPGDPAYNVQRLGPRELLLD